MADILLWPIQQGHHMPRSPKRALAGRFRGNESGVFKCSMLVDCDYSPVQSRCRKADIEIANH